MDNCCLHHKETLKKPEVASLIITAFVDNGMSVDQANKVRIDQCYNLIHMCVHSCIQSKQNLSKFSTRTLWQRYAHNEMRLYTF